MDKYEYRVKTEQMLDYMEKKQYKKAMEIADTIDWRRVKNSTMLSTVSEIYECNGENQKSRDILFIAYDRAPESRKIVYRLGTLAIKLNDLQEAKDCLDEFCNIAEKDPNRYILKYKILKAENRPISEQIAALVEFKKLEYVEKWAYELAKLYHDSGKIAECLEECDDLILWFSEGKYVLEAMKLKMKHKPLTPLQQEKYNQCIEHAAKAHSKIEDSNSDEVRELTTEDAEKIEESQNQVEEQPVMEEVQKPFFSFFEESANEGTVFFDLKKQAAEESVVEKPKKQDEATFVVEEAEVQEDEALVVEESEEQEDESSTETPVYGAGSKIIQTTVAGATLAEAVARGFAAATGKKMITDPEVEVAVEKQETEIEEVQEAKAEMEAEVEVQEAEMEAEMEAEAQEIETEMDVAADTVEDALQEMLEESPMTVENKLEGILQNWEEKQREVEKQIAEKKRQAEEEKAAREEEQQKEPMFTATPIIPDDIRKLLEDLENGIIDGDFIEDEEIVSEEEVVEDVEEIPEEVIEEESEEEDYEEEFDDEDYEEEELEEEDYEEEELEEEDYEEEEFEEEDYEEEDYEEEFDEEDFEEEDYEEEFDEEDFEEEDFEEEDYEEEFEEEDFEEEDYEEEFDEEDFEEEDYEEEEFDDEDYEEDEFDEEFSNDTFAFDEDDDDFEEEYDDEFDDDDFVEEFEIPEIEDDFDEEEEFDEEIEEEPEREKTALEKLEEEIEQEKKNVSPGGVSFDTGFVVQGRYDLEVQSEVGIKAGLTEEQKKLFSYFVPVRGMSEQIVEVLENDKKCKSRYGTSRTGNILIIGRPGTGKTVLAVNVVKAIQKDRRLRQGKVAIVTGDALNKKELSNVIHKLQGGALIIEKAGKMNTRTVRELNDLMEEQTGELLVVLEEQRKPLEKMLSVNPEFERKFTSKLELPIFINDELVTFGQTYAKENGYKIDEMGILALYSRIDILQKEDHAVTVAEVKEILDDAIDKAQRANVKHLMKRVFGKRTDNADRVILTEQDFK